MSLQFPLEAAPKALKDALREVENGAPVEVTDQGRPIAVILSKERYEALNGKRTKRDFWDAIVEFRQTHNLKECGIDGTEFEGLRVRSPGRDFSF